MINKNIISDLHNCENKKRAKHDHIFFKSFKGGYGEGDLHLGINMPNLRSICKSYYKDFKNLNDINFFITNKYHEYRMLGLLFLIEFYNKKIFNQNKIYKFYIKNIQYINNWDLVDISSYKIIGAYLYNQNNKDILYSFTKSKNLWERRISIISTFYFIKNNNFTHTIKIAKTLLRDKEDLIHKAVGWMLREIGKRNLQIEEDFLYKYHKIMPRTMLRYSIEKFSKSKREFYMKK